jgi:peroxiredoxin
MSKSICVKPVRSIVLIIVLALGSQIFAACADGEVTEPATATSTASSEAETAPAASSPTTQHVAAHREHAEGEKAPRNPNERPVPAFEGVTIAGTKLSIRDLLGARIVLFFFNPEVDPAVRIGEAVQALHEESGAHNFNVVGIGIGSDSATLSRFAKTNGLTFPVIDDSSGSITRLLRLRAPNAIFGIDADGYMSFGLGNFPADGDVRASTEAALRQNLRLPASDTSGDGSLYAYPDAPELGVVAMSTGTRLETAELKGQAALVIFFLHTCPHCHHALASIKTTLESIPAEQRPRLVAVSIQNAPGAIRQALKQENLDYFDPYLDPGQKATERWGVTGGVPVVIVLDKEGRIRHRSAGWNDARDPGIVKMKLTQAAGARVPMLLDPKGYSGSEVCGICHEQEFATWQYTAHATAFDTLVTHTANRRTDCVGCHVVGFEEPGGYEFQHQPAHLEDVGCESCHGRGGPHLTPNFVPKTDVGANDYEQVCATCHNPKHSLGFDFPVFHERISHGTIAALSDLERADLLGGSGPSRDLLPTQADYVGSNACQSCHEAEFATWEASPHGHAVESLVNASSAGGADKSDKSGDADCLDCHTTAFGKTGGFVPNVSAASQSDLARVGCESCHGPGSDHIGEAAKRVGTILSLGDKCDSCVILKICGRCHDDANDPGFQFEVEERIETQRHGTIEPAATRDGDSADRAHLSDAFARLALASDPS